MLEESIRAENDYFIYKYDTALRHNLWGNSKLKVFSLRVFKLLERPLAILSLFALQIAAMCNAVSTFLQDSSFL